MPDLFIAHQVLIELGADLEARNNGGSAPLRACSLFDAREVAKVKTWHQAIVNLRRVLAAGGTGLRQ